MAIMPGRGGRRAACGLAVALTAALAALGGESPAGAAADTHSPHPTTVRNIHHYRSIQNTGDKRKAAPAASDKRKAAPAAKGSAKKKAVRPSRIDIPSIGVTVNLMTLGAPHEAAGADDLSLPVPPLADAATKAGWYQFSAVPGAAGNAVIVGHVDTYIGAGVFYDLYLLRRGDPVYVDTGATRQRFDVTSVRELPKPSFPVNQVFGGTKKHMLWLITCGGAFNYETRHYLDNIVVSATWQPAKEKHPDTPQKTGAKRPRKNR
jgi:LPXTG-site transpeptidase (sortase) family protein